MPDAQTLVIVLPPEAVGKVVDQSLDPFRTRADALKRELNLTVRFATPTTALPNPAAQFMLVGHFGWSPGQARDAVLDLKRRTHDGPVIFFDTYDQSSTPHVAVLPLVTRYVKKAMARDLGDYEKDYEGGYVGSDYMVKHQGTKLWGWRFGERAEAPIEPGKMVSAGFFGWARRYERALNRLALARLPWALRPVEINARFRYAGTTHEESYYALHRKHALAAADALRGDFKVSAPGRIPKWRYTAEMCWSRAMLSPFGYGELCFRDVEAVCAGALLIKPDVGHVAASPDLYVAGETYVPVKWDFSDLREQATKYLKTDPAAGKRIAGNAVRTLRDYFKRRLWLNDVCVMLGRRPVV